MSTKSSPKSSPPSAPPSAPKSAPKVGAQFLRLNLVSETIALLPTEKVTQVLTIPIDRVVPMPHMAPWVIGAYNHRGEILWLVDIGHLIDLQPISQQASSLSSYTTIVLQVDSENSTSQLLGLVVNGVNSTERFDSNSIKVSSASPNTEFEKLLKGYWEKSPTEILPVLDLDLIWQKVAD
ncbi:MAG: chemotaxis protein CheW [Pleurocapsa sp. MO_192.B19]|nr:chemotaxis protein CheW [Pleurocapsa sp. MO_192.B19]